MPNIYVPRDSTENRDTTSIWLLTGQLLLLISTAHTSGSYVHTCLVITNTHSAFKYLKIEGRNFPPLDCPTLVTNNSSWQQFYQLPLSSPPAGWAPSISTCRGRYIQVRLNRWVLFWTYQLVWFSSLGNCSKTAQKIEQYVLQRVVCFGISSLLGKLGQPFQMDNFLIFLISPCLLTCMNSRYFTWHVLHYGHNERKSFCHKKATAKQLDSYPQLFTLLYKNASSYCFQK